jgi:glucose/arabinose dehydrogenase
MRPIALLLLCIVNTCLLVSCSSRPSSSQKEPIAIESSYSGRADSLPPPYHSRSVYNFSNVAGWPEGKTPQAPAGFTVTRWADNLVSPRWMYVTPNGDVLVAEANTEVSGLRGLGARIVGYTKSQRTSKSANRITLFRDTNKDGKQKLFSAT